MAITVEELIAVLGFEIEGEHNVKKFKGELDGLNKSLMGFAKTYAVATTAAVTAVTAAVGWLGKSAVQTGIEFENLRTQLVTLTGSTEGAEQSLAWVQEFAKQTPYDLKQTADAFVRLRAYGVNPTTGALESLGNASSAMNKPLDQAVEALADATTGEFERLKEFGIRTRVEGDKVTFSYLQNGKTITRQVRKDSAEIQRAVTGIFDERFAGSMERQAKTLQGQWSKLGDTWQQFLLKISDSGLFEAVKRQLERLGNFIDQNAATIEKWAVGIGQWLGRAVDVFGVAVERFLHHLKWLTTTEEGLAILKAFGLAIATISGAVILLGAAFVGALLAIDDFLTFLQGGESYIGDFVNYLKTQWANLPRDLAAVPAALQAEIGHYFAVAAQLGQALYDGLVNALAGLRDDLMADIRGVPDAIRAEIGRYFEAAKALGQAIFDGLMSALGSVPGMVVGMLPAIPGAQNFGTGSGTPDAAQWGGGGSSDAWRTGNVGSAITNDMTRPNINQSNSVSVGDVNINQTVTTPTQAPGAAAQATGAAVAGAASRLNLDAAQ